MAADRTLTDLATLQAYDEKATAFAADWLAQPAPDDMYALLLKYFTHGLTADIGCGAGRDVAWLNNHGFVTYGYDASARLIERATELYPELRFKVVSLPALAGMACNHFQNVLCETVIMHLDVHQIGAATRRLLDILRPGGTLYLSWHITEGESFRDPHQRLYSAFDKALVLDELAGCTILCEGAELNQSSGKMVHRTIVRKQPAAGIRAPVAVPTGIA